MSIKSEHPPLTWARIVQLARAGHDQFETVTPPRARHLVESVREHFEHTSRLAPPDDANATIARVREALENPKHTAYVRCANAREALASQPEAPTFVGGRCAWCGTRQPTNFANGDVCSDCGKRGQPEAPKGPAAEAEPPTEWNLEEAFWEACTVDTFDLEHQGGYDAYNAMVKQKPGAYTHGEWIRADDYRRKATAANARIAELEQDIARATAVHHDFTGLREKLAAANARADAAEERAEAAAQEFRDQCVLRKTAEERADAAERKTREHHDFCARQAEKLAQKLEAAERSAETRAAQIADRNTSYERLMTECDQLAARVTELELQLACADASLRSATLLCTPEEREVLEACKELPIVTRCSIAYAPPSGVAELGRLLHAELANRVAKAKREATDRHADGIGGPKPKRGGA